MEHDRSISEIREEFGGTIQDVKQKFGMLLDLRDQHIQRLEGRLEEAAQEPAQARVVVVDDAESTVQIMERYLEGQHVEVIRVPGEQVNDHIRTDDFEIMLLEATSSIGPDIDGLSMCRMLCGAGQGAKIIVMSSRPGEDIRNTVEQAGARFLRKPFKRGELVKHVVDMLAKDTQ